MLAAWSQCGHVSVSGGALARYFLLVRQAADVDYSLPVLCFGRCGRSVVERSVASEAAKGYKPCTCAHQLILSCSRLASSHGDSVWSTRKRSLDTRWYAAPHACTQASGNASTTWALLGSCRCATPGLADCLAAWLTARLAVVNVRPWLRHYSARWPAAAAAVTASGSGIY